MVLTNSTCCQVLGQVAEVILDFFLSEASRCQNAPGLVLGNECDPAAAYCQVEQEAAVGFLLLAVAHESANDLSEVCQSAALGIRFRTSGHRERQEDLEIQELQEVEKDEVVQVVVEEDQEEIKSQDLCSWSRRALHHPSTGSWCSC